jgi:hypothetical protein
MVEIRLPAYVFEPNLAGYVAKLLDGSQSGSIIMDFEAVRFYIPTLAQIGNRWLLFGICGKRAETNALGSIQSGLGEGAQCLPLPFSADLFLASAMEHAGIRRSSNPYEWDVSFSRSARVFHDG